MNIRRAALCQLILICLLAGGKAVSGFQNPPSQAPQQQPEKPAVQIAQLRRDFKNNFPLNTGEKLEFEVRFSRFPIYATVGSVTFEFLGPVADQAQMAQAAPPIAGLNIDYSIPAGLQPWRLRATAVSKGILIAILGIDVRDRFESLVDGNDFSALISFQDLKEGKSHTAQSAVFDRETAQVRYRTTDLNKPDAQPRDKLLPLEQGMMSLLSAFYFVRFQKFKDGQMLQFPVSTYEQNYTFDILIHKREKIKTECGKIKTVKLEPKLFGPGKLFNRQGEIYFWVSDDKKHTPLRVMAKTPQGTVTAKLLNFREKCGIIDPEAPETEARKLQPPGK